MFIYTTNEIDIMVAAKRNDSTVYGKTFDFIFQTNDGTGLCGVNARVIDVADSKVDGELLVVKLAIETNVAGFWTIPTGGQVGDLVGYVAVVRSERVEKNLQPVLIESANYIDIMQTLSKMWDEQGLPPSADDEGDVTRPDMLN